jgi:hypothetical protein
MKNYLIILISWFLFTCSHKEVKPVDFINSTKNKDITDLFYVNIQARNERDGVFHYPYFHLINKLDTLIIPSFEYFNFQLGSDSVIYNSVIKLDTSKFHTDKERIEIAKNYSKRIDFLYKDLGVINSKSNPYLGKFIEFTLDEKCKVYYLEDASTLKPYWKNKFSRLKKVDNKWFYECE